MSKLKALAGSPISGGAVAVLTSALFGLSWAGLMPQTASADDRLKWLAIWFAATLVSGVWSFAAQHFRWRELTEPKAELIFDSRDDKHVQFGRVRVNSGNTTTEADEYLYAIGIVNLSGRPISGCRLVLDASEPHDTAIQRLEKPMRPRVRTSENSEGVFVVNPGGGVQPTVFVEVLQEWISPNLAERNLMRLTYATEVGGQMNCFEDRCEHLLAFRLEGDMAKPVKIQLRMRYSPNQNKWKISTVMP